MTRKTESSSLPVPDPPSEPSQIPEGILSGSGLSFLGAVDTVPDGRSDSAQREFLEWLERRYHGGMSWIEAHREGKYNPAAVLDRARSILVFGLGYYQESEPRPGEGRISRYAWGRDYHKIFKMRFRKVIKDLSERFPGDTFRGYSDATPLAERFYAEKAGAGFTGRNTLLISREFGSWLFLGEILTTRRFVRPESGIRSQPGPRECPPGCRRCIEACPTGALYAPFRLNASRCLSYLTVEHAGAIPQDLSSRMSGWIFGCDICQEVCPYNARVRPTQEHDFLEWNAGPFLALDELLAVRDDQEFTRRFAGSPLMRAGRGPIVRNACHAAAFHRRIDCLSLLNALRNDPDPVVAGAALQAVTVLHTSISE